MLVPIYPKPDKRSEATGYLRVGARIARSVEPISKRDCPGGWYAVRPVGFVCVGEDATIKLDHPVAKAIQHEPHRDWPMPYRYGFVRAIAPEPQVPSPASGSVRDAPRATLETGKLHSGTSSSRRQRRRSIQQHRGWRTLSTPNHRLQRTLV
jgi:hypothetical protein